eukprot:1806295-Prymnesium_polylepis.1
MRSRSSSVTRGHWLSGAVSVVICSSKSSVCASVAGRACAARGGVLGRCARSESARQPAVHALPWL